MGKNQDLAPVKEVIKLVSFKCLIISQHQLFHKSDRKVINWHVINKQYSRASIRGIMFLLRACLFASRYMQIEYIEIHGEMSSKEKIIK